LLLFSCFSGWSGHSSEDKNIQRIQQLRERLKIWCVVRTVGYIIRKAKVLPEMAIISAVQSTPGYIRNPDLVTNKKQKNVWPKKTDVTNIVHLSESNNLPHLGSIRMQKKSR